MGSTPVAISPCAAMHKILLVCRDEKLPKEFAKGIKLLFELYVILLFIEEGLSEQDRAYEVQHRQILEVLISLAHCFGFWESSNGKILWFSIYHV